MNMRYFTSCVILLGLSLLLFPSVTMAEPAGVVPGQLWLYLYEKGSGTDSGGINEIYASLGDTVSIDVFMRNPKTIPISAVEIYLTVDGRYFNIVSQGKNMEKNKFYLQPKPFIQGEYFRAVQGIVQPYGNNTHGDSLSAYDNGMDGWQLDYVEMTPQDSGQGRPSSNLRYGVVATFKLIAKAPCDSSTIKLDVDQYNVRVSSYHEPYASNTYYFKSFQTCKINVSGIEINPPLPDKMLAPGSIDTTLDLDEYVGVSSIPDSLLIWSASGNNRISVTINSKTHVVTFTVPNDYKGYEDIIFTVSDGKGNQSSDTMRITVDEPPLLLKIAIKDTLYIHEDSLEVALKLNEIVRDNDDAIENMTWFFITGGNVIPSRAGTVLSLMGKQDFFGVDNLRISVYDSFSLGDSLTVPVRVLPINDPPILKGLPDVTFQRGESYVFSMSTYAKDVDNDPLSITWNSSQNLITNAEGYAITIRANPDYVGTEEKIFTVTDPSGRAASDTMLVTVTPAKNPPVFSRIPKIGFPQGQADSTLVLKNYVLDSDDAFENLKFVFANTDDIDSVYVNKITGRVTFYDLNNTPGWDRITITGFDPDGNNTSTQFIAFIGPADGTPIVGGIPDTTLVAGDIQPKWIDLDDFYYDADNADKDMTWTWGRQAEADSVVTATINSLTHVVSLKSLSPDLYGVNRIFFTVTDPIGKFADDLTIITVLEDRSKPTLDLPSKVGFITGEQDSLDLDDFAEDFQYSKSELTWLWTGNKNTVIQFQQPYGIRTKPVSFTGSFGWVGWERVEFIVSNPMGGAAKDTLTVFSVPADGSPVAGGLTDISLKAGQCITVNLDDYYFDADTPLYNMSWSISGNDSLTVYIDPATHIATVCSPSESWEGNETLKFTVSDPENHSSSMQVTATVTGATLKNVFTVLLFRNPMQEDYMDLYIKSRESLSIQPAVHIRVDKDSTNVSIERVDTQYYYGKYLLPYSRSIGYKGTAHIVVKGTTSTGKAVQDTTNFTYGRIDKTGAKLVVDRASLTIPPDALAKPVLVTVIPENTDNRVDSRESAEEVMLTDVSYNIGPSSLNPEKPLTVGFSVASRAVGAGIYRLDGTRWTFVGASRGDNIVRAETDRPGIFRLGFDATPPHLRLVESQNDGIAIFADDPGSGIDSRSIVVSCNGEVLLHEYDAVRSTIAVYPGDSGTGGTVTIEVTVSDRSGNSRSETFLAGANTTPSRISVEQNSPNPFNPVTHITFFLTADTALSIEVFDLLGRKVRVLADDRFPPGNHTVIWDARDENNRPVSSGTYLYRVLSDNWTITRKMLLLR
ncbi:Ig-like domain-containing protein [bacterium]|nr:Ig-like domain-containing protein [bacterium]